MSLAVDADIFRFAGEDKPGLLFEAIFVLSGSRIGKPADRLGRDMLAVRALCELLQLTLGRRVFANRTNSVHEFGNGGRFPRFFFLIFAVLPES